MEAGITRRQLLLGAAGALGSFGLAACGDDPQRLLAATDDAVRRAEEARRRSGARTVAAALEPRPVTLDLGGPTVRTWGYAEQAPGPLLRAGAGDLLRVTVTNRLPDDTTVHWHGVRLRNDMDGVPGLTQDPIRPGGRFTYEFTVPDPGTYWYHPHVGTQLDRGLYGVLLVDDPQDPGDYDVEWTVVLDDWVDGTGRTPDEVLAGLGGSSGHGGMHGGGHGGMHGGSADADADADTGPMAGGDEMMSDLLGGAGDVAYPHYLANGRVPDAPDVLRARPGQRVRIRLVNAGSDTAFRVALGGHRMTVTHTDGFPVRPKTVDSLLLGMGERYDVQATLADGVFPLVALAEGKNGRAYALVRTAAGQAPASNIVPRELGHRPVTALDLRAAPEVDLGGGKADRTLPFSLEGSMADHRWTINGRTYDDSEPLVVAADERVRLQFANHSMMFHPMHVHGHTFQLPDGGPRKDTVIVRPHEGFDVVFDADNPGRWMAHCHNLYHGEAGMMVDLAYEA